MSMISIALVLGLLQDAAKPDPRIERLGLGFRCAMELPNLSDPELDPSALFAARPDRWSMVQVTLSNPGATYEGRLIVRQKDPLQGHPVSFEMPILLPSAARRRFAFPILRVSASPLEIIVRDVAGSDALRREIRDPLEIPTMARTALIAAEPHADYSHFIATLSFGTLSQDRALIPIAPAELPDHVLGYDGVDLVVLDDLAPGTLSLAQQKAILRHVARGAKLLVTVNRNLLDKDFLGGAAPADVGETENLSTLAALEKATGLPCPLRAPIAVTQFRPRPGAVAWDASAPVVVHGRYESGTIILCGVPLTASRFFKSWNGSIRFMDLLLEPGDSDPLWLLPGDYLGRAPRESMSRAIRGSMVKDIPPFSTAALLLAVYSVLVVGAPVLLFRRRLEWAWYLVAVLAAAGVAVVYSIGTSYLQQTLVVRVSVVEGGERPGPRLRHSVWGIFSANGRPLDLAFDEKPVPFPVDLRLAFKHPMSIGFDDSFQIRRLHTFYQDSTVFETVESIDRTDSIRFTARSEGRRLESTLDAPGIVRAWVVFKSEFTALRAPEGPLDPLLNAAVEALRNHLELESTRRNEPILLYQYESPGSLGLAGASERHLHFGVLRSAEWRETGSMTQWRLLPHPADDLAPFAGYRMILRHLPAGAAVESILAADPSSYFVEAYDEDLRRWSPADRVAAGMIHVGPFGTARIRLRIRALVWRPPNEAELKVRLSRHD